MQRRAVPRLSRLIVASGRSRALMPVIVTLAAIFMAAHVSTAFASTQSSKDILLFGMTKDKESFFSQEISQADRFNASDLKESDFNIELLTQRSVGRSFGGKLIDIRSEIATTTISQPSTTNIGQALRPNDEEIYKYAPSSTYSKETAQGFEYGTQAESDAARQAEEAAQAAESASSASDSLSAGTTSSSDSNLTASSALTSWRTAVASWYGPGFIGRHMANGEVLKADSMVVAHKTLKLGTKVEIRYNNRTTIAIVKDRGPFIPGRDFDLGPGVRSVLGFDGVHPIQYRIVE